jgi:hypothetical protein
MDWQQLSTTSHYQTALAIGQELAKGNVQEAEAGLQELIDAVARAERRALRSQLIRLMMHILKWKVPPERRSGGWASSIHQARLEIEESREEVPSLTRQVIEEKMWDRCFSTAKRAAEEETGQKVDIAGLTWKEVFEDEYSILAEKSDRRTTQRKRKGGKQ